MNKTRFLKFWSLMVGAMDALTGLLLILAPGLVLRMLRIEIPSPDVLVFLSWIGVFVMAVGLSYGFALRGRRSAGETVWMFTALVRMMVCVFLIIHMTLGDMALAWLPVALSDGLVAAVQFFILRKGWWREVPR
jgi:Na+-driven multidrug efflux pump